MRISIVTLCSLHNKTLVKCRLYDFKRYSPFCNKLKYTIFYLCKPIVTELRTYLQCA